MPMAEIILVPTPIGNLEDITFRAINVLKQAQLISAEDTRHTRKLLDHYGITTPTISLHKDNEHQRIPSLLLQVLAQNMTLAVVSDAGTPGISDPGFLIVREALKLDIPLNVLPGPTAFVPALIMSGLPCDKFVFEGFLPPKKGRQTRLQELAQETRTLILYEAPHRLVKTLDDLSAHFGAERPVSISRELSKIHEETRRGTLTELLHHYRSLPAVKGEIVIIVGGKPE